MVNGKFSFEGKRELQGGMYLVVLSESRYFDIIVSEQHFSFTTKTDDLIGAMTFKNSKENPVFYEYLNFITNMQKEVTPLRKQLETAEGENKKALQEKASEVDKKVKEFRSNFIKNHSDKFFTKIINATTEPVIPESPLDSLGNRIDNVPYEEIASGRFRLNESNIHSEKCRRVEFKFRLNDEEYLQQIRNVLEGRDKDMF